MRRVTLAGTGLESSCLGFGCASLGSRVAAAEGARALAAAFEQGVDWLDLAPAYGRGAAETIAADFIRGRRDRLRNECLAAAGVLTMTVRPHRASPCPARSTYDRLGSGRSRS